MTFLIELLLNHKLLKPTKDLIAERIKALGQAAHADQWLAKPAPPPAYAPPKPALGPSSIQSPSTMAILARNPDLVRLDDNAVMPPEPAPEPVAVIAQTPATAQAMASRQQAISQAGKIEKGRDRPRKF